MSEQERWFHIDTDMGVDDGLALAVAANLDNFSLAAVSTVFGNVPVELATRNAILFSALLKPRLVFEVFKGAALASDGFSIDAMNVHAHDGLGGATRAFDSGLLDATAASCPDLDALVGTTAYSGGPEITLVGLGPAANIPRLVELYQPENIKRIVLMGGVFFDNGNVTATAEFNTFCDPGALRQTMALGIPMMLVPLDVCQKVQLSRATVQSYLRPNSSLLTRLMVKSHMSYMDFYTRDEGLDGCFPHDSVAMMVAAHPEWFYSVPASVTVDLHDKLRGRSRFTVAPHSHVEVVTGGKLKFVREFLNDLGDALARWPAAQ